MPYPVVATAGAAIHKMKNYNGISIILKNGIRKK